MLAHDVNVPGIFELNEGEGRPPSSVFQIDIPNCSIFVEDILHVFGANIRGEISDINSTIVVSSRASHDTSRHRSLGLKLARYRLNYTNKCYYLTVCVS